MKLPLVLMAFSMGLAAQSYHYEQGTLVTQVYGPHRYVGGIAHRERLLHLQVAEGNVQRITSPPELGQHRGYVESLGYWRGTSYALAVLSHPVFTRLRDAWIPKDRSNRRDYLPRVLYRSRNGRTWERIATHHRDPTCQFGNFMPLADGRILVDRATRLFEKDGVASPFAIYAIDAQGRLVLDALVPVESATQGWMVARTETGITLMDRNSGKWVLLSNGDGRILRAGGLWQGRASGSQTTRRILHAAPRPDGGILLATENVPVDHRPHPAQKLQRFKNNPRLGRADRLVAQHLQWLLREAPIAPVSIRWWFLDARTGAVQELDPPANLPSITTAMAQVTFRFTVLPKGDLDIEWGMPWDRSRKRAAMTWNPLPLAELQQLLMPRPNQARR